MKKQLSLALVFILILSVLSSCMFKKSTSESKTSPDTSTNESTETNDTPTSGDGTSSSVEISESEESSIEYGVIEDDGILQYRLVDGSYYEVCGVIQKQVTEITVPTKFRYIPVTRISEGAIRYMSVTKITIPESITTIEEGAIKYLLDLKEIVVDESNENYTTVDGVLFSKDKKVLILYPAAKEGASYVVPTGVETISEAAFYSSDFQRITFSDTVKKISKFAFENTVLFEVNISKSVTELEEAFVRTPVFDFTVSENNPKYKSVDGVIYSKDGKILVQYPFANQRTEFTIPQGTEVIGNYAFYNAYVKDITIPNSVKSIGDGAFQSTGFEQIDIPASVTSIGKQVFNFNIKLTDINVEEGNTKYKSMNGTLYSKDQKTIIKLPEGKDYEEYAVPYGVKVIDDGAFYNCYKIRAMSLPDTLETIGDNAFYNCAWLTYLNLPNSVKTIGKYAFYMAKITEINLPEGLKSIGEYAFAYSGVNDITIPGSVKRIEPYTFAGCNGLRGVTIKSGVESIGKYAFDNCSTMVLIRIPKSVTKISSTALNYCLNASKYCEADSEPAGYETGWDYNGYVYWSAYNN